MFIGKLISSILQIIIFSLVPLIWWAVTARKTESFPQWIGLKKIGNDKIKVTAIYSLSTALIFIVIGIFTLFSLKGVETATSDLAGLGAKGIPTALVYAILNTSLPEEILFRGFLLKRLSAKFGFTAANIVQSIIFALMHGVMFFALTSPVQAVIIILFTGVIAFAMGYINEKKADGSIFPSWFIHACANIFSSFAALFSLV